jgi:hypothetical protein
MALRVVARHRLEDALERVAASRADPDRRLRVVTRWLDHYAAGMTVLRTLAAALLSKGVISRGWYAILTGLAMLYVVWVISPVAGDDPAVPFVAVALAVTGVWSIERGVRLERGRSRAAR